MPRVASHARPPAASRDRSGFAARLRGARVRAGLTQAELAGDRYTKAHISALEHGLANPSVEALDYLAGKLGTTSANLLGGLEDGAWPRLEADLTLATGSWPEAVERYRALLDAGASGAARAAALVGLAEALCRLERGREALPVAIAAGEAFEQLGGADGAAEARYWQACAACLMDAAADARTLLLDLLERSRRGVSVGPDLHLRVLIALGATETREGHAERALAYLEEARGVAADLDDRRRATFLHGLAASYRELGDMEAAVATGMRGLALFRASAGAGEVAAMENELALAHLALGHVEQARLYARAAVERAGALDEQRLLAHALETSAQLELADGRPAGALELAGRAQAFARASHNRKAEVSAGLTIGRALRAAGDPGAAAASLEITAQAARRFGRAEQLRDVLAELAELAAQAGDHARAYELSRQALQAGRP
ncbi:MAG TPA: helix-turn-helix transcriptional regulator [Candidatus Baltobacteraceae bacterium]|nr:helix-turn-helix transcriptional regulator [Candidatus Baltobacteraceae bacterium]